MNIPKLNLDLPVLANWDYEKLKIAPCHHFGATGTNDLVIAAHNSEAHFGRLHELAIGDEVLFTDVEKQVFRYRVEKMEELKPTDVEIVQKSGYDLVLYTCVYTGATRWVVFCNRATS